MPTVKMNSNNSNNSNNNTIIDINMIVIEKVCTRYNNQVDVNIFVRTEVFFIYKFICHPKN